MIKERWHELPAAPVQLPTAALRTVSVTKAKKPISDNGLPIERALLRVLHEPRWPSSPTGAQLSRPVGQSLENGPAWNFALDFSRFPQIGGA
jgi:hypothetical protein